MTPTEQFVILPQGVVILRRSRTIVALQLVPKPGGLQKYKVLTIQEQAGLDLKDTQRVCRLLGIDETS